MNGLKAYKKIEIEGETVKICDLSVEYVIRMQSEEGFDNMKNALDDACELKYSMGEVGYKAGLKIYEEIITHTFGEAKSEDSGSEKK